ncbi:Pre-rRNA-processing protein IPI1 [Suhomyces tanzawaensis NRRL Y-17324]|uniref:Pre-rRNA-processing protein n=1 Tax=Suhomyces tanzawaensis NRRL Y-17324 TaxID=984487 RepID=A0A1E4SKC9_9ASCO|nr:Pre-rRNA-processing protein IPI1 [Suhomyces tanzawaensis NRRL Y-17324]ODV79950.1 Pre-rRNA-processing protein IPI1 [Suhomyces tanzawaensis NRRL Y-17324]
MGSKKKKADKRKDFVKPKLRVGKTAAKPDNHTDTSFVAKTIHLPNQSLAKPAGQAQSDRGDVDLSHHLSLTKHHSSTTRKEVLAYIQAHLPNNPSFYKNILTAVVPLILDQSAGVRAAVVSLLVACAHKQQGLLDLHMRTVVLFIYSAMTHILPDIRNDSTKFLQILVDHAGQSVARAYFIKTIKNFFGLLAWTLTDDKKAQSLAITTSLSLGGSTKKARIFHLIVLRKFLEASLFEPTGAVNDVELAAAVHAQSYKYQLSQAPQPFSPLNLFTTTLPRSRTVENSLSNQGVDDGTFSLKDLDSISSEDLETRRKILKDVFFKPSLKNLKSLIKEGGEVGREANSCMAVLEKLDAELAESKE